MAARSCRCGTPLALDHDARLCGPCQRAPSPPRVPADLWEGSEFREAFAARHLGMALRAYRHHPWHGARVSQARLAGWLLTTQAQISRAENGPPPQDLATLSRWAQVLHIPSRHLWFALPADAFADPPPRGPALVPPVDVAAMLAAARAFRLVDRQSGGGHLYRTVRYYIEVEVGPQLAALTTRGGADLAFAATASLTEMLGWMAHDSGHDQLAAQHLAHALRLATASGDAALQANVLASLSHLANALGRPADAVEHAQAGLRALSQGACGEVRARLYAMEARGYAGLQDPVRCRLVLREAERALCKPEGDERSPWASPFDEASLASEAATCMHGLRQLGEAVRQASRVVELRGVDRTRSRALGHLTLAAVSLDQGQVDVAAAYGVAVLAAATQVRSARVRSRLVDLGRALRPHEHVGEVAGFLASLALEEAALRAPVLQVDGPS